MTFVSRAEGRLIAVVGPSGVGKDSVMMGIRAAMPGLHSVRRVITRTPELSGEDYDAVTVAQFDDLVSDGAFAVHWGAHGLYYGIPTTVRYQLNNGTDCLVNFSRKALAEAATLFPKFMALNITAMPETIAQRLAARGRETHEEIAKRLAQASKPLPPGLKVITVSNDGPLPQTVARAVALLQPASV
jgi:ribose 1,5-bisphosphokinase